jgi:hypothetical protein
MTIRIIFSEGAFKMINHDEKIIEFLQSSKSYKPYNLTVESIVHINKFNNKQYEYLCMSLFETFMKDFYSNESFQLRLLDIDHPNACVFKSNSTYYAMLHWGTIKRLYETSLMLTEDESFFNNVRSLENIETITRSSFNEEDLKIETAYRPLYLCGTNDTARRNLAYLISLMSWLTTIYHESGHILHGHLDYKVSKHSEYVFDMIFNENEIPIEERIVRKTIEKDADEFAGNRLIEYIFRIDFNFFKEFYNKTVTDKESLLKILFAGVTLKFLLYGIKDVSNKSRYLPNAYRTFNILHAGYAKLKNEGYIELSSDAYDEILVDTIISTMRTYNKKFANNKIDELLFIKQLMSGHSEDIELKKCWNIIRPKLEKHKHPLFELPHLFDL